MEEALTMNQTIHLQVISPILTVDAKRSTFVVIPAGSIVNTSGDFPGPGFHPVAYDGQDLLAFTRDIRERTEEVSTA
jgi:hypothetical protein